MTEKRFAISDGGYVFDKEFNAFCPSIECVVKLMNKLNDENEQLKHSIKCLEADKMELQQYIKRMQGDVE